jgi:hypothetical protein
LSLFPYFHPYHFCTQLGWLHLSWNIQFRASSNFCGSEYGEAELIQ